MPQNTDGKDGQKHIGGQPPCSLSLPVSMTNSKKRKRILDEDDEYNVPTKIVTSTESLERSGPAFGKH
jgi:hypothetical protein